MWILLFAAAAAAPWPAAPDILPGPRSSDGALLHAELRPLGFSPEGAFAYLLLPPDEAVGCYLWSFQVIDLATDRPLYSETWANETCDTITDFASLQAARGDAFVEKMQAHGVAPGSGGPLRAFPAEHEGRAYEARLVSGALQRAADQLQAPLRVVMRADVGAATIGEVYIQAYEDMPTTWGHEILGYLASPFEPRVVVLVREVRRGWEGPPNVEGVRLFGASLEAKHYTP